MNTILYQNNKITIGEWEKDFAKNGALITCVIGLKPDGGIKICADDKFTPTTLANYIIAIAKELRKMHEKSN